MLKFLKDLIKIGFDTLIKFVIAFGLGTAGGAVVCWYYGFPLGFSVVGGILVLGITLALISDSGFLS